MMSIVNTWSKSLQFYLEEAQLKSTIRTSMLDIPIPFVDKLIRWVTGQENSCKAKVESRAENHSADQQGGTTCIFVRYSFYVLLAFWAGVHSWIGSEGDGHNMGIFSIFCSGHLLLLNCWVNFCIWWGRWIQRIFASLIEFVPWIGGRLSRFFHLPCPNCCIVTEH